MTTPALGVFNQVHWFGVGDVDECWVISSYWTLVAAGIMSREQLPGVQSFRNYVGRPDSDNRAGHRGGTNANIYKGLKHFAPGADIKMVVYNDNSFAHALQSGYIASLALNAKYLPRAYQHRESWGSGGPGPHQVAIVYQGGKYYIMDPLAKEGSALLPISLEALRQAAGHLFGKPARTGFMGDMLFHAVLVKAGPQMIEKIIKDGGKLPPDLPRDFNYQAVVRNYLNPWDARDRYQGRHKRQRVDGTPMKR